MAGILLNWTILEFSRQLDAVQAEGRKFASNWS